MCKVAVLLATYKMVDYVDAQIKSIALQEGVEVELWVSRDNLCDEIVEAIQSSIAKFPNFAHHIFDGPQKGFQYNFLSLVENENVEADYFAFADQDDIWKPDKLKRAIKKIGQAKAFKPALYCGRTELVDKCGVKFGYSPLFTRPPSFRNALVQNIGGGNTMVFNNAARSLLLETKGVSVVSHDWWLYQLVSGAGGYVFYDATPMVLYRQHEGNIVGHNQGVIARLKRCLVAFRGRFNDWNQITTKALTKHADLLTEENRVILEHFIKARSLKGVKSMVELKKSRVYRQTKLSNLLLYISAGLNKI